MRNWTNFEVWLHLLHLVVIHMLLIHLQTMEALVIPPSASLVSRALTEAERSDYFKIPFVQALELVRTKQVKNESMKMIR